MEEKNKIRSSTLYLVGTPIGNLADISERAKKVLSEVSFIAAEDTRNSLKLLSALGIHGELVSYHEHNRKSSGERIIARLLGGESCALITDAGMPAISDPGEDIVMLAQDAGLTVSVVPGPCAAVSALAVSGLPTGKFVFEGFLSPVKGERRRRIAELSREERTVILYEAPHKLKATLSDLCELLGGERKISLCRELTKLNEEVFRTDLNGAVSHYEKNEPRGEFVLIIEGCKERPSYDVESESITAEELVGRYVSEGMSKTEAIKKAAKEKGINRSELYKLLAND